jgi:hypothetical protein
MKTLKTSVLGLALIALFGCVVAPAPYYGYPDYGYPAYYRDPAYSGYPGYYSPYYYGPSVGIGFGFHHHRWR